MSVALGVSLYAWSPTADAAPSESKQYDSSGRYQGRTDKDGKVTLAEMTAFHEKKMGGKKAGKSEMSSTATWSR